MFRPPTPAGYRYADPLVCQTSVEMRVAPSPLGRGLGVGRLSVPL